MSAPLLLLAASRLLAPFAPGLPVSLVETLERLAAEAEAHDADCGLAVYSLQRESYLVRRKGDRSFIPASNNKLLTTGAALHLLGPNYFFQTRFFGGGPARGGVLEGDLWVVGGGDPCWSGRFFGGNPASPMESFAEALHAQGITRIAGRIVLDDRFFDREFVPPGWPRDQLSLDYCAPTCGLPLAEGCVEVEVLPTAPGRRPALRVSPGVDLDISNEAETEAGRGDPKLDFAFVGEASLRLRGSVHLLSGPYLGRVAVSSPLDFFGSALRQTLLRKGIAIDGSVARVGDKEDRPAAAKLLYTHRSPLFNALVLANKESSNFFAEHLLKTLGAEVEKEGSRRGGVRAVRRFLEREGIPQEGFVMEDGSGLSNGNRLTADLLVGLLSKVYRGPHRETFLATLSVSGTDGTLEKRLDEEPYRGSVLAKTGWIQGASALSGFATSRSGEVFAFSVLINYRGKTQNRVFKGAMDSICRALVDSARLAK